MKNHRTNHRTDRRTGSLIRWLAIFALVLIAGDASAQHGTAVTVVNGTGDPSSCQPQGNNIFINRASTPVLKICTAGATWTALMSSSGGTFTGQIGISNGTATEPSIVFTSDDDGTGTGIFRSAANAIGFTTNGTERWIINASGALNPLTGNTYDIGGSTTIRDIGIGRNAIFSGATSGTATLHASAVAGTGDLTLPTGTDTLVGKATTDIFTNKSLDLASNTVTATLVQLNTAVSDDNVAGLAAANLFTGDTQFEGGSGTATYRPIGVICALSAATATTAVVTEEDLFTCTIPANTLDANGRSVRLTAIMRMASNANTKTVRVVFGATSRIVNPTTTAPNGQDLTFQWVVMRTGSASQMMAPIGTVAFNGTTLQAYSRDSPTADTTAAIVLKVTGQNGTASAGDINLYSAFVEFIP